ncbi:MAG: methyltransferase domain-containing protein [Nitrospirae bacterium]|nr:MAG: methyltransferase domain-containing protein [Nitrospirota bacterium]
MCRITSGCSRLVTSPLSRSARIVQPLRGGKAMTRDIFQMIGSLDSDGVQRVVDRLEYRGRDEAFVTMREEYLSRLEIVPEARILDLGCGTGVVARALATRDTFHQPIVGVDFSEDLVAAATRFATEEGIDERVEFRVGDASALEDSDTTFDIVILHTVVSHVPDPVAVISEASRVVRPGGAVAIFDGDYASLSLATGEHEGDSEMVQAILSAVVANPYVMRQVPSILQEVGLDLEGFMANVLAEAGEVAFFLNLAESYVSMAIRAQLMPEDKAREWLNLYRRSVLSKSSFGSCNYYTYLTRRVG